MPSDEPDPSSGRTRRPARTAAGTRRRSAGARAARLRVAVVDGRGRAVRVPGLAAWLAATAPGSARGAVTVALVGNRRMRELNRDYRGSDYATDVLSFPAGEPEPVGSLRAAAGGRPATIAPVFLGDIVVAAGVAARQARTHGHSLATELRVLALHGLLHLLGYDHERDDGEMAACERRLRRRGGLTVGLLEREGGR